MLQSACDRLSCLCGCSHRPGKRKRGTQPQPADQPRLSERCVWECLSVLRLPLPARQASCCCSAQPHLPRSCAPWSASQLDAAGRRRALYHCNYCQKDISNTVRIKCAVCADFDLCLECFSVGAEVTPHRSDHAYRVVDCLSFPLYHPDWGVRPARPARPGRLGPVSLLAGSAGCQPAPASVRVCAWGTPVRLAVLFVVLLLQPRAASLGTGALPVAALLVQPRQPRHVDGPHAHWEAHMHTRLKPVRWQGLRGLSVPAAVSAACLAAAAPWGGGRASCAGLVKLIRARSR